MLGIMGEIPLVLMAAATALAVFAGFVKGAVGFALPMILISGMGSILPAEWALAGLILPTLVSNLVQGFAGGWREAWGVVTRFRVYIVTLLIVLALAAQLVTLVPDGVLFGLIGLPVTAFALTQIVGWSLTLDAARRRYEIAMGVVAGLMSGFSGTWGPPTVMYLTAIGTGKRAAMRAQGVIYLLGSIMLLVAHLRSGILDRDTVPWSLWLIAPVLIGMWIGGKAHARMNPARFRQMMLWVLLVAGLNLIRRGIMG